MIFCVYIYSRGHIFYVRSFLSRVEAEADAQTMRTNGCDAVWSAGHILRGEVNGDVYH